jgi:hypothetical protein
MEEDGSLTYSTSPNFYASKRGEKGETTKLSVAEAKEQWPDYSKKIDAAAADIKGSSPN